MSPASCCSCKVADRPSLCPCDEPSTQGYDSLAVPIPENRRTPADADHGAGPHMPVKNLVHRSPHRMMSSEIGTLGCPAATAER